MRALLSLGFTAADRGSCEHVRELFQIEPSSRSRFWCEKGQVRK
jgi:hypothetical protein